MAHVAVIVVFALIASAVFTYLLCRALLEEAAHARGHQ
jgi:hypothetical protein